MKTLLKRSLLPFAAVILLFGGCGKQETKAPAASTAPAPTGVTPEVSAMKATVDKSTEQAKPAADQFAGDMTKQAQRVIDKAKALIGDKKYQDAVTLLQQVTASKISPAQRKIIDDLIAQAQKLMASDMGQAVQGLIKK